MKTSHLFGLSKLTKVHTGVGDLTLQQCVQFTCVIYSHSVGNRNVNYSLNNCYLKVFYPAYSSLKFHRLILLKKWSIYFAIGKSGNVHPSTGRTAHRGSRDIALLFLDHDTRRLGGTALRSGRSLPPGKTRYPLCRRLGGPHGLSGRVENLAPTGIGSADRSAPSQSLYRLRYPAQTALYICENLYLATERMCRFRGLFKFLKRGGWTKKKLKRNLKLQRQRNGDVYKYSTFNIFWMIKSRVMCWIV